MAAAAKNPRSLHYIKGEGSNDYQAYTLPTRCPVLSYGVGRYALTCLVLTLLYWKGVRCYGADRGCGGTRKR
eukprot:3686213-Rhodomonas_salina.2